jgi:hypothetical protein
LQEYLLKWMRQGRCHCDRQTLLCKNASAGVLANQRIAATAKEKTGNSA